jgi:hypothetical protein
MAIKVLELHHQGVRVGGSQDEADRAAGFYRDVLGLGADPGRPDIPGIPGYWVDVGGRAQIHLMGVRGGSVFINNVSRSISGAAAGFRLLQSAAVG